MSTTNLFYRPCGRESCKELFTNTTKISTCDRCHRGFCDKCKGFVTSLFLDTQDNIIHEDEDPTSEFEETLCRYCTGEEVTNADVFDFMFTVVQTLLPTKFTDKNQVRRACIAEKKNKRKSTEQQPINKKPRVVDI